MLAMRDLVRRRVHSQQGRTRIINRIHRLLETANIKLSSVQSRLTGTTGRKLLVGLANTACCGPNLWLSPPTIRSFGHARFDP
jgi:hypothetical protein